MDGAAEDISVLAEGAIECTSYPSQAFIVRVLCTMLNVAQDKWSNLYSRAGGTHL